MIENKPQADMFENFERRAVTHFMDCEQLVYFVVRADSPSVRIDAGRIDKMDSRLSSWKENTLPDTACHTLVASIVRHMRCRSNEWKE